MIFFLCVIFLKEYKFLEKIGVYNKALLLNINVKNFGLNSSFFYKSKIIDFYKTNIISLFSSIMTDCSNKIWKFNFKKW